MPLAPPDPLLLAADLLDPPPRELVPAAYVPHQPHPPQREFLEQRIDSLRIWHRKALHALPLLQLFLGRQS